MNTCKSVYAFDADSGQVLWQVSLLSSGETPSDNRDCNRAGTRDRFGPGNKFITPPSIANGKVYLGTTDGVAVFGLLY